MPRPPAPPRVQGRAMFDRLTDEESAELEPLREDVRRTSRQVSAIAQRIRRLERLHDDPNPTIPNR